jgi:hypothetical protein
VDINAADVSKDFDSSANDDINDRVDDYFKFITPTLMGKVNDDMNNSIRRYDLNELKTYEVMFADFKTNPDGTYTVLCVDRLQDGICRMYRNQVKDFDNCCASQDNG